ncbi:hypothetical protein V3C99_009510 [Haemonchus contortus]|uniref:Uncharacterized protein n=1 Tax=Haemonchus contortus TaxID=6289 RepID=A0A7I4YIQ8_HAECO
MSYRLTTATSYCRGLKASSTMSPSLINSTASWPAHGSTTISCGLTRAPSYYPGFRASSTMSPSLMSSTASSGQHTAAPPHPADLRQHRHIILASRQAAPCPTGSRQLRHIVLASRQAAPCLPRHHHILRTQDSSVIMSWPQGKQHHVSQSHEQHRFVASTLQHHHILRTYDTTVLLSWLQGKQHHVSQPHEQHGF